MKIVALSILVAIISCAALEAKAGRRPAHHHKVGNSCVKNAK